MLLYKYKGNKKMYDKNNVFAKIVRGEIPATKVYENEHAMSFHDVNPVFETHVRFLLRLTLCAKRTV